MTQSKQSPSDEPSSSAEVFIVHGHNTAAKAQVTVFLSRLLGQEPVVLHEQPNVGHTIIEKFEHHAGSAAAAVVLLTADDRGAIASSSDLQPRARQNVILELGYFVGKLGRRRVVLLYEPDIELPSDLLGLLYIPLDAHGAWRVLVARELRAAGLDIDLSVLIRYS